MNTGRHLNKHSQGESISKRKRRIAHRRRRRLQRKVQLVMNLGGRVIEFIRAVSSAMEYIGAIYTAMIALCALHNWLVFEKSMNSNIFLIILCVVMGIGYFLKRR